MEDTCQINNVNLLSILVSKCYARIDLSCEVAFFCPVTLKNIASNETWGMHGVLSSISPTRGDYV